MRAKLSKINKNNDLISVILPVYNAQNTIERAVESITKQTYLNLELIIIDDGSNDNSNFIIRNLNDDRIKKIYLKKNKGLVFCLNLGVNSSKGSYIARMDADDIALPNRLSHQIDFLKKHKLYDLVGSQLYVFEESTKNVLNIYPKSKKKYFSKLHYFSYELPHPTWMARSDWIKKYKYNENNIYSEDQELLIRASINSNYYLIEKPLLLYSKSEVVIEKKIKSIINILYRKIFHYCRNIKIYRFKLFINILFDTLYFLLRFIFYLIKVCNNRYNFFTVKNEIIDTPPEIKNLLKKIR